MKIETTALSALSRWETDRYQASKEPGRTRQPVGPCNISSICRASPPRPTDCWLTAIGKGVCGLICPHIEIDLQVGKLGTQGPAKCWDEMRSIASSGRGGLQRVESDMILSSPSAPEGGSPNRYRLTLQTAAADAQWPELRRGSSWDRQEGSCAGGFRLSPADDLGSGQVAGRTLVPPPDVPRSADSIFGEGVACR